MIAVFAALVSEYRRSYPNCSSLIAAYDRLPNDDERRKVVIRVVCVLCVWFCFFELRFADVGVVDVCRRSYEDRSRCKQFGV